MSGVLPSASFKKKPKVPSFTIQQGDDNFDYYNTQLPRKRVQFVSHFHHGLPTTKGAMVYVERDNPISHSSPMIVCFGGNNSTRVATKEIYYLELEPRTECSEMNEFEWKKIEISKKQNPDHVPPPGFNTPLVYSPKLKCLITTHTQYGRPVHIYCFVLEKREWIMLHFTGIWYMDEIDLYCTNEYLFLGYLTDTFTRNQALFRIDLDIIGDLLTKENENTISYIVKHPKCVSIQCDRFSDSSIYRKVYIYSLPGLPNEEQQFHICVFGRKDSHYPATEVKSLDFRSLNTNSKFTSIPIEPESAPNRTNSYLCRIPCNTKEDVYEIPKSMLLSYLENNRITFIECEYPKSNEKPQQFLLRYNNIPIQLSIQVTVFRPFLHCYLNKHGKRVGIYIVNSQLMYFINLDYLAPNFCFNLLKQGSLSDINIITRSNAFI